MPKHTLKTLLAAVVLGLSSAATTELRADDQSPVGVVRITDKGGATPQAAGAATNGQQCDNCDGGGNDCHRGSSSHCPVRTMLRRDGVTYSPDHGFRRPVVEHIQRDPVEYHRYWPTKWYGEPGSGLATGSYPMVYTPTDTTQLGYYYQRVPQWRPNPGMIPPRPWPSDWHRREVCNNCDDCREGRMTEQPQKSPTPEPAAPATPPQSLPPTPAPAAPQAALQQPPAVDGLNDTDASEG